MRRYYSRKLMQAVIIVLILVYFSHLFHKKNTQTHEKKFEEIGHSTTTTTKTHLITTVRTLINQDGKLKDDYLNTTTENEIPQRDNHELDDKMGDISVLRSQRIKEMCVRHNFTTAISIDTRKLFANLLVSDKHKVIFCSSGDIHSMDWKKLLEADNVTLRPLSTYREESISYRLKYYFKFMHAQHPIARLFSVYKNYFTILPSADQLSTKYQKSSKYVRDEDIFFEPRTNISNYTRFENFVSLVIKNGNSKESLHPLLGRLSILCQPCTVHYDYISKLETISYDTRYILSELLKRPGGSYFKDHMEMKNFTELSQFELQESLTIELADKIYKLYESDFEMLGYFKPKA